ncbi:sensor histidine kinase [Cellulomonas sp. NS3]|uniref:sensor histidine kinase n=1 Tax=Cellulomonas sp. NS3 TaxID=2973977 RepID=UPI0021635867|nr:sensor histidine kinase [Cellulomonas sp. NS3]
MTSDVPAPTPAPAPPSGADAPADPATEPSAASAPPTAPTPAPIPAGAPAAGATTAVQGVPAYARPALATPGSTPTAVLTAPAPGGGVRPAGAPAASAPAPTQSVDDDLRVVAPALTGGRELLRAPVSAATWRAVSQATVGLWLLLGASIALVLALGFSIAFAVLVVGIPLLVLTLLVARPLAGLERSRLHAQLGVDIPAPEYRSPVQARLWRRAWGVLTDVRSWAHLAYALLGLGVTVLQALLVWVLGGFALAMVFFPLYVASTDVPVSRVPFLVVVGLVGTWVWPLALQALTLLHVRLARGLLGWPRSAAAVQAARVAAQAAQDRASQAEVRAVQLRETRTRAVGTAEDDRRRIERDLHDGAQQRLVALGVELGVAKRAAAQDPVAAAAALDHAHREVKETLAELRDLVRGIHPAVLTDRGLDAALSALAARCTVPVTVDVPDPASLAAAGPSAQAAAYFVTAEALTNVARHSGARTATVRATVRDSVLRLEVVDGGRGGATARPGSGLDGLRSRVEVLDGTLTLDSPVGGGTRLTVEVPCAS